MEVENPFWEGWNIFRKTSVNLNPLNTLYPKWTLCSPYITVQIFPGGSLSQFCGMSTILQTQTVQQTNAGYQWEMVPDICKVTFPSLWEKKTIYKF